MEDGSGVPTGVFYGGLMLWLTREVWGVLINRKKDSTEINASVALVSGLAERIKMLEESQLKMELRIRDEVELRMSAQEQAHQLMLDVIAMKSQLKGLGVVMPEGARRA